MGGVVRCNPPGPERTAFSYVERFSLQRRKSIYNTELEADAF